MQIKINIQPENEEKFIQALDATNIPYWIEENKPATQDISSDEEAAAISFANNRFCYTDDFVGYNKDLYTGFLAGCQHGRQYSITKP